MRDNIIDIIRENDPEYRPLPETIEKDPLFRFAEIYIKEDGYNGPWSAREILERLQPELSFSQAKKILRWKDPREECLSILKDAADSIEDYREIMYVGCDDIECEACLKDFASHEVEETLAQANDIKRERFRYVYEIYGRGII